MTAKTLSTSTLSLKFMQNAHRAKNLTEVQLERAEVKDDGEWEVAKEIRDTWGPETAQSVSYEASYLPFLFTSDASGSVSSPDAANLKGRRAFKRGREVSDEYQVINVPAPPEAKPSPASTSKSGGKPKQPSTISGRTGSSTNTNSKSAKANANANAAPKSKSARQAIYDNSGVGADLRKVEPAENENGRAPSAAPPFPNVFLKPAGVDEPVPSAEAGTPKSTTRKSKGKGKGKREREQEQEQEQTETERETMKNEDGDGGGKKRKRKKKNDDHAVAAE